MGGDEILVELGLRVPAKLDCERVTATGPSRARVSTVDGWGPLLRRSLLVTAIAYGPLLGAGLLAVLGLVHDFSFSWQLCYAGAMLFGLPTVWILLCARVLRRVGISLLATLAMLVLAGPPVLWSAHQLRLLGLRLAAARMQPLAHAVERCLAATGRLPERLADLVPRYLDAMPARVPPVDLLGPRDGQPWLLVATFVDGLADGYEVAYLPAGVDAAARRGERIDGNWVWFRF